jgi:simple sugar transport system permease protein
MKALRKLDKKTVQLFLITVVLFGVMVLLRGDRFLRAKNIESMLFQLVEPGLFAMCIAVAYMSRGMDLSIVSIANLVGVVNGMLLRHNLADDGSNVGILLFGCVVIGLAIGLLCGVVNAFFISNVGIFPILVTLGTQNVFMGIAMALTQGRAEGNFPQQLLDFGDAMVGPIPLLTILFLVLFVALCVLVHKTPYGKKLQWMGSNSKVTWFTGIDNPKITYITYMLSGMIASLAGLVIMARTNSAKADYGTTYVFQALLTCVLAGISPLGGTGKVYNLILSIVAIQITSTGFNMLRISPLIRDSIFGALLVISIIIDFVSQNRRARKLNRAAIRALKEQTDAP